MSLRWLGVLGPTIVSGQFCYGQSCGQLQRFSPRPHVPSPQFVHTSKLVPGLVQDMVS